MKLFIHSWRLIFGNLNIALRIGGPLAAVYFAQFLLSTSGSGVSTDTVAQLTGDNAAAVGISVLLIAFVLILAILFISLGTAIAWHRYVLWARMPGEGLLNDAPYGGYFGRSLLVGIIVLLPFTLVLAMLTPIIVAAGGFVAILLTLAVYLAAFTILTRLSLILPAIAVGKKMTLGESWAITEPLWREIMAAMAIIALIQASPMLLAMLGLTNAGILALVQAVTEWLVTMLGISILTTLYGHLVENRPLNA